MKVVVLAGGYSPEREVSLCSGSLIANALMENGHRVKLWDLCDNIDETMIQENLFLGKDQKEKYQYEIQTKGTVLIPGIRNDDKCSFIGEGVLNLCKFADVVFMALHGSVGENGKLQAVFDLMGIRYTGSGYVGSMLAMDKKLTKQLLEKLEVKVPKWISIEGRKVSSDKIEATIGYPCVVKPANCGSSIGVKMVSNKLELKQAIEEVRHLDDSILVEEMIVGREFSVGIINNKVLPVIEIIPRTGFYDYENKYQAGKTSEICPANISYDLEKKIERVTMSVHEILQLGFYSRIDIMMNYKDDIFVLEANTLPGMTPTSLLPQEAKAAGISYEELCDKILLSSFEK